MQIYNTTDLLEIVFITIQLCIPEDAKFTCCSVEISSHRKFYLDRIHVKPHMKEKLNDLCTELYDIVSQYQVDTGHAKLITIDIETEVHPL